MWGTGNWGQMVWGNVGVPTLPFGMLLLLMVCCFLAGGYFLRPERRGRRSYLVASLLVTLPLSVAAVTLPYTFANGTTADATQVNANFAALATASDIATCPAGMTRIGLVHSTLCYASGPVSTWDQAASYCSGNFRARICNFQQWRDAVCDAGVANPGGSWTDSITGAGTVGTISSCTGDSIASAQYSAQRVTTCCAEWSRY